jgi:hypothetical protein
MHLHLEDTTGLILNEAKTPQTIRPPSLRVQTIPIPSVPQQKLIAQQQITAMPPVMSSAQQPSIMRPYHVAAFWSAFDTHNFSLSNRTNNHTQLSLFTFDIVISLNDQERGFLVHARLAHLPSKQILKLTKQ